MNHNNPIELTILMPCLNEERTVGICVNKARNFLQEHDISGEIIVADNGSTDDSVELALNAGAQVINVEEKGYGSALIAGIKSAKGKYVIMGDADDSYDFFDLMPLLSKLREGNALVMGNRFGGKIEKGAMPFLHRYLGNPVLSFVGRLFFKTNIRDFHCGLRGFDRKMVQDLELNCTGMEFASEMVVKSVLANYSTTEVSINLYKDGRGRPSHLNTFRDGWRHLRFLLIYSPTWLFLYPGAFLFLFGTIMTILLLMQPIHVFSVILDVNSLAYSASISFIGIQLLFFFVYSRYYAEVNGLFPGGNFHLYYQKYFSLEKGLLIGILLFVIGTGLSIYALLFWKEVDYGNLSPRESLRIVIPAIFSLITGMQIIQSSFLLSLMELKKRAA